LKLINSSLAFVLVFSVQNVFAQFQVQIPDKLMMADVELNIREGAKSTLAGYVSKLTGNNKYFRQMVDRADAYLPIVERIFTEEGLPEDFKYLVIQESSLVSYQVSSSNAVGYWQFKKETATEMGLRVDEEIDERMNIVSSSRSAAKYLMRHNNYMQNWPYSLLAYYAGLGGAKTLINPTKIGTKSLDIDENTHWYILKFIAHKIAFEPHLYRNTASPNLRVLEYGECENKSLEQLANETKYPVEQLQFYNRWILKGYVPGDRDYTVILPLKAEDGQTFDSPVYVKASPPIEKLEPWREKIFFGLIEKPVIQPEPVVLANGKSEIPVFFDWNGIKAIQAKAGDNSAKLALLAGISRDEFLEYNDLRVFDPIVTGEVYYTDHKKKKSKIPFHTVQRGETLWEVAQKYGLKLSSVLAKNKMPRPEKLKPGRILWLRHSRPDDEPIKYEPVPEIPKLEMIATKPKVAEPITLKANNPAPVELKQIENQAKAVLGNDTLKEEIAETKSEQKESEDVEIEIVSEPTAKTVAVNKPEPVAIASTNSNLGNELIVPTKPESITPAVVEMPKEENGEIMVTQGMTWYKISRHYKRPLDSLYTWNSGSNRILNPGQKIRVSRSGPKTESIKVSVPVQNVENSEPYEVKTGDTAYKIAQKFGMKIDDFLSMNQKEDAALKIGEVVKVAKSK